MKSTFITASTVAAILLLEGVWLIAAPRQHTYHPSINDPQPSSVNSPTGTTFILITIPKGTSDSEVSSFIAAFHGKEMQRVSVGEVVYIKVIFPLTGSSKSALEQQLQAAVRSRHKTFDVMLDSSESVLF